MSGQLLITGAGVVSPVGFNAATSCSAIRARIRNVGESPFMDHSNGAPIAAGRVQLPHGWDAPERLGMLLAPALLECFETIGNAAHASTPVFVGVAPPDRPGRYPSIADRLLADVEHELGARLHPESRVIAAGNTSVVQGLELARAALVSGTAARCIVAGVDSFLQPSAVRLYAAERRILTEKNSNGFSPGEAGCAVTVELASKPREGLAILSTSLARESATIRSEEPRRARGLIRAAREALDAARLQMVDMDYRISDLNGEHYKFKEAMLVLMALQRRPKPELIDILHPIDCVGEIGAAIGPLTLALSLHFGRKGAAFGPLALHHFSDDEGERAAIVTRYSAAEAI